MAMLHQTVLCALLLAHASADPKSGDEECDHVPRTTRSVTLTVVSQRMDTGQWETDFTFTNDEAAEVATNRSVLNVTHTVTEYDDRRTVKIRGFLTGWNGDVFQLPELPQGTSPGLGKGGGMDFQGPPWSRGFSDLRGPPGIPGLRGPAGLPGLPGVRGPKGETGAAGPPGLVGLPGIHGFPGEKGDIGMPGIRVRRGYPGQKGSFGAPGPVGPRGKGGDPEFPGIPGPPVTPGIKGDKEDQISQEDLRKLLFGS